MSFCPNCGTKLNNGVKFCTECGAKVAVQTPVEAPAPVYTPPVEPEAPVFEAPTAPTQPVSAAGFAPDFAPTVQFDPGIPEPETTCQPPVQSYEPPVQSYEPPVQSYEPPVQSYEPPVQSYEPPVQSYTPPVQSYTPPVQSYTPPVQTANGGSYTPPPAPPKAEKPARTPKEPKDPKAPKAGGIKKLPIIIGAAVLVILLIVLLVSCGGKNQGDKDDWGVYEGVSCVVSGMELDTEGEWIELQKKGKATICIMETEYKAKWKLDGEKIEIQQGEDTFAGTLSDGILKINLAGMDYTFAKDGAQTGQNAEQIGKKPAAAGPVAYKLIAASEGGEEFPADLLEMMGGGWVVFNGDGTGLLSLFGDTSEITYDEQFLMSGGEKVSYILTDNGLEFTMEEGSAFVFEVTDEIPDLTVTEEPEEPEDPVDEPVMESVSSVQNWNGDYYGFWVIDTVWETEQDWVVEDAYWDCCATVEVNEDGTGILTIWDEDYTKEEPLAELGISVSESDGVGRFCGEEGYFMGAPLEHADWLWYSDDTAYENMFMIDGAYEDGAEDFWYCIYLLPWGADWSDVEADDEPIPYYYYDWYLPMVNSGVTEAPVGNVGAEGFGTVSSSDAGIAGGEGIVELQQLIKWKAWLDEVNCFETEYYTPTYGECVEAMGVEPAEYDTSDWDDEYIYVKWMTADEKDHIIMTMKPTDDGEGWRYHSISWSNGVNG